MSSWAAPGVRCVCVRDDYHNIEFPEVRSIAPRCGDQLTVTVVSLHNDRIFLMFAEIPEIVIIEATFARAFWVVDYFRPLVSETQDVEMFREILCRVDDPILRADEYERSFEDAEALLERAWRNGE